MTIKPDQQPQKKLIFLPILIGSTYFSLLVLFHGQLRLLNGILLSATVLTVACGSRDAQTLALTDEGNNVFNHTFAFLSRQCVIFCFCFCSFQLISTNNLIYLYK